MKVNDVLRISQQTEQAHEKAIKAIKPKKEDIKITNVQLVTDLFNIIENNNTAIKEFLGKDPTSSTLSSINKIGKLINSLKTKGVNDDVIIIVINDLIEAKIIKL